MSNTPRQTSTSRRDFLRQLSLLGSSLLLSPLLDACQQLGLTQPADTTPPADQAVPSPTASDPLPTPTTASTPESPASTMAPTLTVTPDEAWLDGTAVVGLVRTDDRVLGALQAIDLLPFAPFTGKRVLVKPNFNSGDPPPASTDFAMLKAVLEKVQATGAVGITVGDRSGMGDAARIMQDKGGMDLAAEMGFDFLDFDALDQDGWEMVNPPGNHWTIPGSPLGPGFPFARPVIEAGAVVSLCCLKTHRYGGITMSLKNSVGMVASTPPGAAASYMQHLHSGDMDTLIAEINLAYSPALVVLDGVDGFISGGPARGKRVSPGVVLAGSDRVALDSLGVAILKMHGSNLPKVSQAFHLREAIRLGIGVDHPEKIRIVTADDQSQAFANQLYGYLTQHWA